jgi:hypothetical protein
VIIEAGHLSFKGLIWKAISRDGNRDCVDSIPARLIHQGVSGAVGQRDVADDGVELLILEKSHRALQTSREHDMMAPPAQVAFKRVPAVNLLLL